MSEIPALFAQRPIVERHKRAAMYHPCIEGLAMTLVDVPVTFVTMVLYTVILYFLVKLQQTAGQFLLSPQVIPLGYFPDYFIMIIASFSSSFLLSLLR
jgi:ABC-type multidrug transport system permease subunit